MMCTGPIEQRAHLADLRADLQRATDRDAARDTASVPWPGVLARLRQWLGISATRPGKA